MTATESMRAEKKHGAQKNEADSKREPTKHAKAKQSKGRAQPPQMAEELERAGEKKQKQQRKRGTGRQV